MTKQTLSNIALVIFSLLMLDMISLFMWQVSNQKPVDSFYAGAITANIINLLNK